MVYDAPFFVGGQPGGKKMPAYVYVEVEILNPEGYKAYGQRVPATVEKYGGRFLVRGGKSHVLEGEWPEVRRVILEFPSVERAQAWWDSTEYAEPKEMRRANSKGRLILIEGVS
jgi:uncharacterized protein (DUF1330 family)